MHAVMSKVTYVQKGSKKVNNQYNYVSHDAVVAKIRPALVEAGIVTTVTVCEHAQDGNRTDVTIEMGFHNVDNAADTLSIRAFGFGIDPQDKGPGKAVSYAVKYALLKTFCLETGDDPDHDDIDYAPEPEQKSDEPPAPKKPAMSALHRECLDRWIEHRDAHKLDKELFGHRVKQAGYDGPYADADITLLNHALDEIIDETRHAADAQ